eukprot:gene274-897_t
MKIQTIADAILELVFIVCIFAGNSDFYPTHNTCVLFGTKTAYETIRDFPWPRQDDNRPNSMQKKREFNEKCKPSQLNMLHNSNKIFLFRHGTRFPGKKDIRSFKALEKTINEAMKTSTGISQKVKVKFPWKNPFEMAGEKQLSETGDDELYDIGRRYAMKYPAILAKPFAAESFTFQSTCKSRCSQSAFAFAMAYFKGKGHLTHLRQAFINIADSAIFQPVPILNKDCDDDFVLRFYDNCPKYVKEIEDNSSTLLQMDEFSKGTHVSSVLQLVRERLGLNKSTEIDFKTVFAMYKSCAFAISILGKTLSSGWCTVFDSASFQVMEYVMDLKTYYESGPFYPLTSSISCELVKDIIDTLSDNLKLGVFRFAHSSTLLPLFTEMGFVNKTEPLRADNFMQMKHRVFRSGAIAPFAANIAFVKYNCNGNPVTSYVKIFINEKPASMKFCKDPYLCTITELKARFKNIANSCNLSEMCKV